jgi:hypothetical protein
MTVDQVMQTISQNKKSDGKVAVIFYTANLLKAVNANDPTQTAPALSFDTVQVKDDEEVMIVKNFCDRGNVITNIRTMDFIPDNVNVYDSVFEWMKQKMKEINHG